MLAPGTSLGEQPSPLVKKSGSFRAAPSVETVRVKVNNFPKREVRRSSIRKHALRVTVKIAQAIQPAPFATKMSGALRRK